MDEFLPQSQQEPYLPQAGDHRFPTSNVQYNGIQQKEPCQNQAVESLNRQPSMELHAAHPTLSFSQPPFKSEPQFTSLSQLGRDLFAIANSPRAVSKQQSTPTSKECNTADNRSAFSFM